MSPLTAVADPDGRQHDFVRQAIGGLLFQQKEWNLSPEQVDKIKQIGISYAKVHVKAEADAKLAKIEAVVLAMDDKADLGTIEAAMHKRERAETMKRLEAVKALRAAKAVLNADQEEAWKMHMMKIGKRFHERQHGDRQHGDERY